MSARRNRFDEKRASRFAAAGIDVADLASAETFYMGEDDGAACCLCDHPIKYCFGITFANRPGGEDDVTMAPVGSNCITHWMRALPDCPERDAALANVKAAERRRDELVRAKRKEERAKRAREKLLATLDEDAAGLMRRYFALDADDSPKGGRWDTARDIGGKVERYRSFTSDRQRRFFAVLLGEAESHIWASLTDGEKAEAIGARMDDENHAGLMRRYYRLPEGVRCETLLDMAAGVERWGHFRSPKAARYFAAKLRAAEQKVPEDERPTETATEAPDGDDVLAVAQPENMGDFPF